MTDNTGNGESGPADDRIEPSGPALTSHPDRTTDVTSRWAQPAPDPTDRMPTAQPVAQTPAPATAPLSQPSAPVQAGSSTHPVSDQSPPIAPPGLPSASIGSGLGSIPPTPAPGPAQAPPSAVAPAQTGPAQTAPAQTGSASPPSVPSTGWSPLGATPSAPPVRTGPQAAGTPHYLPPVAPPTAATIETVETTRSGSRWGWRALLAFLAGGLIAAGGFGAAQLGSSVDTTIAGPITVTTSPPTTVASARDTGTVPLAPADADEPAAFVAQTLGPAVVQLETDLGLGSGVIFGDGLILTNNHVVAGADELRVKLADGRVLAGRVLGTDVNTDVGVVTVGPGQDLPIAQLATGEKARVGQVAIAIGSPFDLQQSVTAGIVSAVDRPIQNNEQSVVAMIQTDAPINPGNSGGALADRQGRVIGINTSIQTDGLTAANVGVGFAIPIDTAIRIADLLVAGEPINPGFLGVRGDEPAGGEAGVELTEVTVGSAADLAGLRVGDRVLSLDGAPVTGFPELAGLVLANQAGDTVALEVIRDGELVELDVTLGLREGN